MIHKQLPTSSSEKSAGLTWKHLYFGKEDEFKVEDVCQLLLHVELSQEGRCGLKDATEAAESLVCNFMLD